MLRFGHLWKILALVTVFGLQITYLLYRNSQTTYLPTGVWHSASSLKCEECDDGRPQCFPHREEPALCGRCLPCLPTFATLGLNTKQKEDDIVLALKTTPQNRAKVLVLIATIHKYYKELRTVVFEEGQLDKSQQSMKLLHNVDLLRFEDAFPNMAVPEHLRTPFYIHHVLLHHRSVLWLADDLEFTKGDFFESLGAATAPIVTIGNIAIDDPSELGFIEYFPGYQAGAERNFTAILARRGAKPLLEWAMSCFSSQSCGSCSAVNKARPIDCFPFLLHRLSYNFPVKHIPLPQALSRQTWEPPSCDALCMLKFTTIVFTTILFLALCIFVASDRFISKKER